jgi:DNA-binding transcriptional MerR regulator
MDKKRLYEAVSEAVDEKELGSRDIPNIDLYVDQILNIFSSRLYEGSERYHDRLLTKTMINNYSKEGLITPIKGKKYSKEQILQMLTVYTLKSTLSIGEIKRILVGLYSDDHFGEAELTGIYDKHLAIKEENKERVRGTIDEILEKNSLDIDNDVDYISLICALSSLSAQLKSVAQAMIGERFPDNSEEILDADKDKKKEEKKEEKKEKKEIKEKEKEKKKKDKDKSKTVEA